MGGEDSGQEGGLKEDGDKKKGGGDGGDPDDGEGDGDGKEEDLLVGQGGGKAEEEGVEEVEGCLLYTSPSPRDLSTSRMPSSA